MAIKSGQIIHDVHGFVIDRIQTGGVSNLNIPQEKIYELGNYQTVATVRDIPDLSFDMESFDVSCEVEALIHGVNPSSVTSGQEFAFSTTYPIDVISPFKAGNGVFTVVKGIAVPYLNLEQVTYRFGVGQNATQQFTLRGDGVYYIPGSPYSQTFTLVNNTLTYNFTNTALPYEEAGNTLYALGACVKNTSGAYKRLFFGTGTNGYSNTSAGITLNTDWFDSGYTTLHVVYGSATVATYSQAVHPSTSVKPAAVRAKDTLVYVGDGTSTSTLELWSGVQSFEVTRRVNLDNDEEFGNSHYVSSDYDTADVTGSITVKAADATALWDLIHQVSGTTTSEIAGPIEAPSLEVMLQVRDPDTGDILKTWDIPDAKFTLPGAQGRVQQKLEVTFPFTSDAGLLSVYNEEIL